MAIPFEQVFQEFSPEEQAAILARAEELRREELNLREMRRLRKLTQTRLSKKLKIGQEGISRIEKRTDLYLSTLRSYVEGVGGKLSLVVEFPDHQPILLTGLGEPEPPVRRRTRTTRARAKAQPGASLRKKAGKPQKSTTRARRAA